MNTKVRRPGRTWGQILSLTIPLAIVGLSAMAISYLTLIDVARTNGLPLPELFPVLIDVGTVACMVAAAQFRAAGIKGRGLAYVTFALLSSVSVIANATHAIRAADLTATNIWFAMILAATPPAALLAITHLVMQLVPDEKERARLAAAAERDRARAESMKPVASHSEMETALIVQSPAPTTTAASVRAPEVQATLSSTAGLHLVRDPRETARERVLEHLANTGERPTGALVGEWLGGKSAKTGQRFLASIELEAEAVGA